MALSPQIAAADTIDVVRQLYVSADYESALEALDRFADTGGAAAIEERERFRALCLIALGRTTDAEAVFERIIRANPAYAPDEQQPPRVRAAFAAVRSRVLPEVARTLFTEGRAAYDRKAYATAVPAFERTLAVLDQLEPDEQSLGDLRTLTTGFLDLSRSAALAPAPPALEPAAPAAASDVPASPTPTADGPEPSAAAAEITKGPEVVRQIVPPWNPLWFATEVKREFRGAVEVSIDESGAVASARIVEAINPVYDQQLLDAAAKWRYVPAERNGKPVASTKRVEVILRPRND
jgi:TonB family protein